MRGLKGEEALKNHVLACIFKSSYSFIITRKEIKSERNVINAFAVITYRDCESLSHATTIRINGNSHIEIKLK